MNIVLITPFLIHILTNPVDPRTATPFSVNGQSGKIPVRRTLISNNRETGLRRSKRDIVSWNRMRNTLSKVSRNTLKATLRFPSSSNRTTLQK